MGSIENIFNYGFGSIKGLVDQGFGSVESVFGFFNTSLGDVTE